MTFLDHVARLFSLTEIYATLSFGPEPVRDGDRKALAGKLWRAVMDEFTPAVILEEECAPGILIEDNIHALRQGIELIEIIDHRLFVTPTPPQWAGSIMKTGGGTFWPNRTAGSR